MNENLDLTKILEGCPEGTEFYSTIYGEVRFVKIDYSLIRPIIVKDNVGDTVRHITSDGRVICDCGGMHSIPIQRPERLAGIRTILGCGAYDGAVRL